MSGSISRVAPLAPASQPDARPERVADRIRADLLVGTYRPGEFLRLVEMEAHYRATRSEVRSALATLAAVELLEHVPNRGYRVAVLDETEAWQHTELRLMLEVPAAVLVLRLVDAEGFRDLRREADRFAWCVDHGTTSDIEGANHRFHRAFFAHCGNPRLEHMINEARERAWPQGWMHWKTVSANRASAADHFALVDALESGDEQALRRVAFRHLLWRAQPRDGLATILGVEQPGAER